MFWEAASGNFDVQNYRVTISTANGITTLHYTNTTFMSVHTLPDTDNLVVSVSTISKCGQVSDAAVPENSANGFVRVGKYLN